MRRLLYKNLLSWRQSKTRKPLLLRGARQVGKTHLVREFGKEFDSFIEVNFEKNPDLKVIFEHNLDPHRITRELSIAVNKKIEAGKTLLFIDEIQEAPKAIIALRYFYEEMPNLHIIAAGSLVDFAIDMVGIPVGRVEFLYMYPMSFLEYLVAKDCKNLAVEIINHKAGRPIAEVLHNKALRLLGEYMAIGGMPEVVAKWIEQQDLKLCGNILKNIKNAYEQDFLKYTKQNEIKYIDLLFKNIPSMICQHFKFSNLSTDFKKRELEPSLNLLEKAGIINRIIRSSGDGIPLGANTDFKKFKLSFHDIGLTQTILGIDLKEWFITPELALVNKGNIAESFVGQELLAYSNPHDKQALYYWHREQRSSQAEIDYLITSSSNILPIEVKSGHSGKLQSMRIFLENYKSSPYGIIFSTNNYAIIENIHSYPLYAVAALLDSEGRLSEFITT